MIVLPTHLGITKVNMYTEKNPYMNFILCVANSLNLVGMDEDQGCKWKSTFYVSFGFSILVSPTQHLQSACFEVTRGKGRLSTLNNLSET
jgi:hypothetical protein